MDSQHSAHIPVLLHEVLNTLEPRAGETVLDGTVGLGGHSAALLERITPGGLLIGIDRDESNLATARERLAATGSAFRLFHGNFSDSRAVLDQVASNDGNTSLCVDVMLLDVGVASTHLDRPDRGFSFMHDGPLDMRMDASSGPTAADMVNTWPERQLADLIYQWGEEPGSRRIARAIVDARRIAPFTRTLQLADVVVRALGGGVRPGKIHPATRTFQALRIQVNGELDALSTVLADLPLLLAPGGRIGIISFHSLEDRLVKEAFRAYDRDGVFELLTKKPIVAGDDEQRTNPRSRSAKLRVARRVGVIPNTGCDRQARRANRPGS